MLGGGMQRWKNMETVLECFLDTEHHVQVSEGLLGTEHSER